MMSRVHSRGCLPKKAAPSARSYHTARSFRPCRSSRLRRFTPHRHRAGLLHPASGRGVRQVSVSCRGASEEVLTGDPSPLASHPSKHFPHQQPYRVTAADTFSPFHRPGSLFKARRRARRGSLGWQPTSRCCSTGESVACGPALPPARCSMLPWALIPLKASPLGTVPSALQRRPPSSAPRRSGEHRKESLGRTGPRLPD